MSLSELYWNLDLLLVYYSVQTGYSGWNLHSRRSLYNNIKTKWLTFMKVNPQSAKLEPTDLTPASRLLDQQATLSNKPLRSLLYVVRHIVCTYIRNYDWLRKTWFIFCWFSSINHYTERITIGNNFNQKEKPSNEFADFYSKHNRKKPLECKNFSCFILIYLPLRLSPYLYWLLTLCTANRLSSLYVTGANFLFQFWCSHQHMTTSCRFKRKIFYWNSLLFSLIF